MEIQALPALRETQAILAIPALREMPHSLLAQLGILEIQGMRGPRGQLAIQEIPVPPLLLRAQQEIRGIPETPALQVR